MIIHVMGDGTVLSLIDCDTYASYIGDWDEPDRLRAHLLAEARQQHIVSWGSGFESDWRVEVHHGITEQEGYRDFLAVIECTSGVLHLANYDSLTMAAQFDGYALPDEETADYAIELPKGLYKVRVVQLLSPDERSWDADDEAPHFLLELEQTHVPPEVDAEFPWADFL